MTRLPVLGLLLLGLTACGTTVPLSQQAASSRGADVPLGAPAAVPAGGAGLTDTTAGDTGGSGTTGSSGSATSSGARVGGAAPAGGSGAAAGPGTTAGRARASAAAAGPAAPRAAGPAGPRAAVPLKGRGWDATHVYVGVITTKDTQQVYGSYGAKGVDPGDTAAQAAAVAKELNAHGGILGRTVVPVIDDVQTLATASDPTGAGQSACTYFTQDHPVIAVWNVNTQIDQVPTLRTCLAKASLPFFSAAARAITDPQMARLAPSYYHTIMVSWDALAPVLVARLQAQGWFGSWDARLGRPGTAPAKVGVLVDGTPEGTHTGQVLSAAVKAAGHGSAVVFQYAEASQGQAAAVQKFNGSGVTHVIVTDVELTAFQNAAASQRYLPRYGITSYNDPYSNLEASGLTPPGAMNGAMGVGWTPNLDVADARDPGRTTGGKQCDRLMDAGGQTFGGKRLAHLYASSLCDTFSLLARGATAGGGFDAAALRRGIVQGGTSFSPANGFAPALTAAHPFVQGRVRDLAWGTDCSCARYGRGGAAL